MDLCTVKQSFTELMGIMNPWTLSHFVMWLDIKVAEYKVYGKMILDNKPVTTPDWLRSKPTDRSTSSDTEITSPVSKPPAKERNLTSGIIKDSHSLNEEEKQDITTNVVDLTNFSDSQMQKKCLNRPSNMSDRHGKAEARLDRTWSGQHQAVDRHPLTSPIHLVPESHSYTQRNRSESHCMDRSIVNQSDSYSGHEHVSHQIAAHAGHTNNPQSENCTEDTSYDSASRNNPVFSSPVADSNPETNYRDNNGDLSKAAENFSASENYYPRTNDSHNVDLKSVKVEVIDEDCDDTGFLAENRNDNSLPNFGQAFATSSRHAVSKSHSNNHRVVPHGIQDSKMSAQNQGHSSNLMTFGDYHNVMGHSGPVPISMYMTPPSDSSSLPKISLITADADDDQVDDGQDDEDKTPETEEQSWRNKKWQYIESLRGNSDSVNPKVQSRLMQRTKVFPDPFPVERLKYGQKAQEMINSGIITRPAKMQFLDTVFDEIVKYTGLYPTPTQKMEVAKAIVTKFPKLNVRSKDSHISPADSWFVVLNDKFRNERRGLNNKPFQSHHIRQRALMTVRRAQQQVRMCNMATVSRSLPDIGGATPEQDSSNNT